MLTSVLTVTRVSIVIYGIFLGAYITLMYRRSPLQLLNRC